MKTTSALRNAIPQEKLAYGRAELKRFINLSTIRSFFITISLFSIILILFLSINKANPPDGPIDTKPFADSKIKFEKIDDILFTNNNVTRPASTEPFIDPAIETRAGKYVPVSDELIKQNIGEIAKFSEQYAALSHIGNNKIGEIPLSQNKSETEKPIEINVREEDTIPDIFSVDKPPQLDYDELLKRIEYPAIAIRTGTQGRVTVKVLVDKYGKPQKAMVVESVSSTLNNAALKAIMESVFTPAIQNGNSVPVWVEIPVNFILK
jgi:TonB family protein